MNVTPDGDYQTYKAESGAYVRENFFGRDPRTARARRRTTPTTQIWGLKRGGHDYRKVYAAYKAAVEHKGQPTVILAKTIKGYGLGPHFEGRNATHQMKKLTLDDLKHFRDAMRIPITDAQLEENPYLPPYYHPGRRTTSDPVPAGAPSRARRLRARAPLDARRARRCPTTPPTRSRRRARARRRSPRRWRSSACSRTCCASKDFGHRIVPIIPDEARTFGMDAFFPTAKIYNPNGQHYTSVDRELLLAYKESPQGQILHVGINEAGAVAAFTGGRHVVLDARRAADPGLHLLLDVRLPAHRRRAVGGRRPDGARLHHRRHRRPHDADRRGPAARRRPLAPAGVDEPGRRSSYDPAYGYEIAHIVRVGPRADVRRTSTRTRTSCTTSRSTTSRSSQPAEPEDVDVDGIVRGIHHSSSAARATGRARRSSRRASACRGRSRRSSCSRDDWGVRGRRLVGHLVDRAAPRRPRRRRAQLPAPGRGAARAVRHARSSQDAQGPVVAVSDFMHAVQDQIRQWVPQRLRDARRRRLRLLATRGRRPPVLQDRRPVDRRAHAAGAGRGRARSTARSRRRRSRSTGCTT